MWLLPTRNRPELCAALIASMKLTGDVPEVAVMMDGDTYAIEWPPHWHIHQTSEHLELGGSLNRLVSLHPNEPHYGFITDHSRPQTEKWAMKMEAEAEAGFMVLANDLKNRFNPATGYRRITSASCYPGELIRSIGWLWLPEVVHMFGDDALELIGHKLGIVKYLQDVVVRDLLVRDGEIPRDANHERLYRGKPFIEHDRQAYLAWDSAALIERLREKAAA